MRRRFHLSLLGKCFRNITVVVWCLAFSATGGSLQSPHAGLSSIRESDLRPKVTYLASKALKGRGNGSPELRTAAEYVAEEFRKNGVKPAGDAGTYFQNFQMFTSRLGPGNEFAVDGSKQRLERDYVPHYLSPSGVVEGPLVFVGYGMSAPSLKLEELSGVDLRGKIAVVLDHSPRADDFDSPFSRIDLEENDSIQTKARYLHQAGALAVIVILNPSVANFSIADIATTFRPEYSRKDAPMGDTRDPRNPPIPVVIVSTAVGRRLVPSLGDLQRRIDEALRPQSVDVRKRAVLKVEVLRDTFTVQNVVGLIEGSHPRLREEVVLIGAHYDHDGEERGQIWPGADDNASGTAGLIELAEAFRNVSPAPARSILLCAFAGEEKGEIGSYHYAAFPVLPLNRTVAMLQMDMIGRNEEHGPNRSLGLDREVAERNGNMVNLIGATFSADLRRALEDANRPIGLDLRFRYDDTPENLLRRSDQWPFLQKGVPAIFVHTGEHPDYHAPGDTVDKINFPKMEKIVRLVYLAVEDLANAASRPLFQKTQLNS